MRIRHRIPYIMIMSTTGGLTTLYAWQAWQMQWWVEFGFLAAAAGGLLAGAALMAFWPPYNPVPDFARRFEVANTPHGLLLRCRECGVAVLPVVSVVGAPRLITSMSLHEQVCEGPPAGPAVGLRRAPRPGGGVRHVNRGGPGFIGPSGGLGLPGGGC